MIERHDTTGLEIFVYLDKLFNNGITKEWLYILAHGDVFTYDGGIVSSIIIDDVCYINSGSHNNIDFTFEMQKKIISIIKNNVNVIMQASYPKRVGHVFEKLGFRYNAQGSYFEKGDEICH